MQSAVAIIAGKAWSSKEDLLLQTTKFIISIVKQNTMSKDSPGTSKKRKKLTASGVVG